VLVAALFAAAGTGRRASSRSCDGAGACLAEIVHHIHRNRAASSQMEVLVEGVRSWIRAIPYSNPR
jgi:hypothetical protein